MIDGKAIPISDIVNPPDRFLNGLPCREYESKDALSLSARRIPEFAKRRNIREMFQSGRSSTSRPKLVSSDGKSPNMSANHPKSLVSTPLKRPGGSPSPTANRLFKRSKSNTSQSIAQPPNGQASLAGFLKPKTSTNAITANSHAIGAPLPSAESILALPVSSTANTQTEPPRQVHDLIETETLSTRRCQTIDTEPLDQQQQLVGTKSSMACGLPDSQIESPAELHDSFESKVSWSRLFTKPQPPRCQGHDEPCVSMTSKRKGGNQGRSFWMCRRPLGPSGEKERGTEWRCGSFIWCSDWRQSPS